MGSRNKYGLIHPGLSQPPLNDVRPGLVSQSQSSLSKQRCTQMHAIFDESKDVCGDSGSLPDSLSSLSP